MFSLTNEEKTVEIKNESGKFHQGFFMPAVIYLESKDAANLPSNISIDPNPAVTTDPDGLQEFVIRS